MNAPTHVPRARRGVRVRLLLGVVFAVILAAATAALPGTAKAATAICSNQTGTNGGYYYQMWSAGQGSACVTLNSGNSYSTTWSGIGDFVAGVGWNPGNNSAKTFSGSLSASGGTSLVSLYGWSTSPLVEYYVIENYVGSPPTAGTYMGQVTSDGGTYNIYEHQQVNQPSIQGTATFEQYLAIRTSPTSSGTITTQNFFNAWASHGMNLGTLNYQILATESFGGGSGSSNVTVNSGSGGSGGGGGCGGGGGSGGCTATLSAGLEGKQLVQPQRLGHRLQHLDRDDGPRGPRGRLLHLERQRHLPQPVRAESHAQRQRQQLGCHHLAQRPMDLAHGLL